MRQPPRNQLTYSRHCGKFFLHIIGHWEFGPPFGQDCLIPTWVTTLALRQKSRTVEFETAPEMLNFFKLGPDGYHGSRLIQGFKRIFSATIFFGTEEHPDGYSMIDWGSEFAAVLELACRERGVKLFVLPPRSPKLNGQVERANRTHIEEFYEITPFSLPISELNRDLRAWEHTYETVRPHQALGYLTLLEFLAQSSPQRKEP